MRKPKALRPDPHDVEHAIAIGDVVELGGAGVEILAIDEGVAATASCAAQVGVWRNGPLPAVPPDHFDCLLCAEPRPPAPWVGVESADLDGLVAKLAKSAEANPVAASVLAQVLRMSPALDFQGALVAESLAYSMLLRASEFQRWRASAPPKPARSEAAERVGLIVEGNRLTITLRRPARRNAFDAAMRDALADALQIALDMGPDMEVLLTGEGPSFSAGGDLGEFGSAKDPALAHAIRVLRSPAGLVHRLGHRLTAEVHGACIGAGIEVPAAARRVVARRDAYFRLPEVGMGLIPGAGGTASIPRRIGRQRTFFMALSGLDIDASTALAWGLVDEVV